MINECIDEIKNVFYSDNLVDIKRVFNKIGSVLNSDSYDKDFDKKIVSQMKREINKYQKKFKDKYPDINNLYIYPCNYTFLYFCSMVVSFKEAGKRKFKLLNCVNACIELLNEFETVRGKYISFDKEMELLLIADRKYSLFSLLNSTDKIFHLYNFPCIFNPDSCEIMSRKRNNKTIIDLLLFDQENVDRNAEFLYITLLGRIINFILIDNLDEGPYGMTRFLKRIGLYHDNIYREDAPAVFSYLFSISLLCDSKYSYILNEKEKEFAPLIDEYVKNVINIYKNVENTYDSIEFPDDDLCPCESGKLYKNCCKKKNFKWVANGKEISRQIPIDEEVADSLK